MLSKQAERLYALKLALADLLDRPSRHPDYLRCVDFADAKLRTWAGHVIGWGC